jgi:hypothetical protein
MSDSFDLTKLDPGTFEHLANALALRVLGAGHTSFGPGSDAGRDGYFEGEAPYPSEVDRWSGRWYIQSKFHKPHLSKDPQKWLLERVKEELAAFANPESKRVWPDNWILVTNVDPSGTAETGAYDAAIALIKDARPPLVSRFALWGGSKVLDLLSLYPDVSSRYAHFLTPGHVFTALFEQIKDAQPEVETILRNLIVRQLSDQQHTKLEQAGSDADTRPGIHRLFVDLPFQAPACNLQGMAMEYLVKTSAQRHSSGATHLTKSEWREWSRSPSRARVWFVKGGPGQGKSTFGQYFCQIQRASLILQDDCFLVPPNIRALAEEIREAAQCREFWPCVPRIPLTVELREFAQFFGRRGVEESKGILTFVAQRLSAGIEQAVSVGTLKRALRIRSWFFVFDGLDEVPHDVKDKVAGEVMHFLDDVLVETDSDALALCTSRPQGYAGEFANLDGPIVELINLNPEQALACATPVLKLGRSMDEAEKYCEILKSATDSPSVRELMTTPLQCHIMAVVVRDGGRPPERRWQLYTNFYQVIKRREANRDLADRRLARLLREDTQLLKTVHNRLGFALHARAETSKGAQTHLDRGEFRVLIEAAVAQMIEGDAANTVDVLMEATTDRLVLVNTPDNGDHVRFDIRPLQEFFAAEFIYESVNAEELRKRIDVIGGDAHWREVMHFLLSALVENGRHTELSVAVDALESIDRENGELHSRLLRRRIGRGALLAARLLQEGVLEQDKRIRQQFRTALEPLCGLTGFIMLHPFTQVGQPNSRSWYLTFLIEAMREADRTESIGAATLLAYVLPDDDKRTPEVQALLLSSPTEYVTAVFEGRMEQRMYTRGSAPPSWLVETALKVLLRPEWPCLESKGLRAARDVLQSSGNAAFQATETNTLSPHHLELLRMFLLRRHAEEGKQPTIKVDYGIIKATFLDFDSDQLAFERLDLWDDLKLEDAPGVLQVVYRLLRFARSRSARHLFDTLRTIEGQRAIVLGVLPEELQALLPVSGDTSASRQVQKLIDLGESGLQKLIDAVPPNQAAMSRRMNDIELHSDGSKEQWQQLVNDMPATALVMWSDSWWTAVRREDRPEFLDKAEAIECLIERVLESPCLLTPHPHLWGRLLVKAPQYAPQLRRAFREAAAGPVVDGGFWRTSLSVFELVIPSDGVLLPHLANYLASIGGRSHPTNDPKGMLSAVGEQLRLMIPDCSQLECLASDYTAAARVRAAAMMLTILHPDCHSGLPELYEAIAELYSQEIGIWFLRVACFCIRMLGSEADKTSRLFIGSLLDASRSDYHGRAELQALLSDWREFSNAPIQTSGTLAAWLDAADAPRVH